jgi:hypothetical protein
MASVIVRNLAGKIVTEISPIPATIRDVKLAIESQHGSDFAYGFQSLTKDELVLSDDFDLEPDESFELTLCLTELPLFSWDFAGNPASNQIVCNGGHLTAPNLRSDFVNVVTQEPLRKGLHYFQFVVHTFKDEQWCGIVANKTQAGDSVAGYRLEGCFYYLGRAGSRRASLRFGSKSMKQCVQPKDGDVVEMLIDVDAGALAFGMNGSLQSACKIFPGPAFVFTTVDRSEDHVELRKLSIEEAPAELAQALKGSLIAPAEDLEGHPAWCS